MKIRTNVLLLPLRAWKRIDAITKDGLVDVTPQQLASITKEARVKSGIANAEEIRFFDDYYAIVKERVA